VRNSRGSCSVQPRDSHQRTVRKNEAVPFAVRTPVTAVDGHSCEEAAISEWLKEHATSPLTNEPLASNLLVPNQRLRAIISTFLDSEGPAATA